MASSIPIRDSATCRGTLVLVATDNTVWIMGRNNKQCLGVDTTEFMTKPSMTDIKLEPNETINRFYRKGRLVAIYTSSKKLYISRVLLPSLSSSRYMDDDEGVYPSPDTPELTPVVDDDPLPSSSEPASIVYAPSFTLEWPQPPATDFAMPYISRDAPLVASTPAPTPEHDRFNLSRPTQGRARPTSRSRSPPSRRPQVYRPLSPYVPSSITPARGTIRPEPRYYSTSPSRSPSPPPRPSSQPRPVLRLGSSRPVPPPSPNARATPAPVSAQDFLDVAFETMDNYRAWQRYDEGVDAQPGFRTIQRVSLETGYSLPLLFVIYHMVGSMGLDLIQSYASLHGVYANGDEHPYYDVIVALDGMDICIHSDYSQDPVRIEDGSSDDSESDSSDGELINPLPAPYIMHGLSDDESCSDLSDFDEDIDFLPKLQGTEITFEEGWPQSDYGLGADTAGCNVNWHHTIECTRSVSFASRAGFVEPMTDIDEVTFAASTVFFRRGNNHYVYNWALTGGSMIWANLGLAVKPYHHAKALIYFKIILPFRPDSILYRDDMVYMCTGPMHHVLTSFTSSDPLRSTVSWFYFELEGMSPNSVYISNQTDSIYVHHANTLYRYMYITRELEPIVIDNDRMYMLSDLDNGSLDILCASTANTLVDIDTRRRLQYAMIEPGEVVRAINYSGLMLVDSPSTQDRFFMRDQTFCINTHDAIAYQLFTTGAIVIQRDQTVHVCTLDVSRLRDERFQFVETFMNRDHAFCISTWTTLPSPISSIHIHDSCDRMPPRDGIVIIQAGNQLYQCSLNEGGLGLHTEITLGSECPTVHVSVTKSLIDRPTCGRDTTIPVNIETYANRCERLALIAEMFKINSTYSVSIYHQAKSVSYGKGVKRVFVQDALAQFATQYLTQHCACTSIKLEAFESITAPQLFAYGRMLHLAMAMTKQQLSIRLPTVLLTAILDRELTISELEYMAAIETPEAFKLMQTMSDNTAALADCGYDSYRECLEQAIHYQPADTESQQRLAEICRVMANGIKSLAPIKNLERMNLPTIDYYMSGDYYIDRQRLKSKIQYTSADCELTMTELIHTLPEEKLAILLKNWSGTTVVQNKQYYVGAGPTVHFATCSLELGLPRAALTDSSIIPREALIELLTTPVNYIEN